MHRLVAAVLVACSCAASAAEPQLLTAKTFARAMPGKGIVTFSVNWGRKWGCAGVENAQLQRLVFVQLPLVLESGLDLKTPSKLFVDDRFVSYTYIVDPGTYALSGFDVKVARSPTDVGHVVGTHQQLFDGGTPLGGTFNVTADEIVYIGHFGLDCAQEAIPWRYYLEDREGFDHLIAELRGQYPFASSLKVRYGLLDTKTFGQPFTLPDSAQPNR